VGSADGGKRAKRDRQAPSAPESIRVHSTTQTKVVLKWDRARDNIRVAGYDVWVNGERDRVRRTSYAADGLACGQSIAVWIAAFDWRGNRSPRVGATASTTACLDGHAPTPPTGFRQEATSQTAVVLSWSPSADNVGVVGYGVYEHGLRIQSPAQPTVALANLACDRSYGYEVDSVDAAGNRSRRTQVWVQTSGCPDVEEPGAPPGLAVSARTGTSVTVGWLVPSDNVGVVGYEVSVGGGSVTKVTETRVSLTGLTCGTTYSVAVAAVDAAGNSSPRATLSAPTAACPTAPTPPTAPNTPSPPAADTTPPTQPAGLAVTGATQTTIGLSWAPSTDDKGVSAYAVFRNGTNVQTTTVPKFSFSGLACGTAYAVGVEARDAAGNRSTRASVVASTSPCADKQAPTVPTGPVATSRTANSIALIWSAASDNVGVAGYGLYRGGTLVGTAAGTTGVFTGLTCNTNYTLAIDAFDAAGNRSAKSGALLVATTACPDTTPPAAATGLAVSAVSPTGLTLSWKPATDNVGVTGYDVYRAGAKVASVTTTTSVQSGLACATSYALGVVARDAAGNSSQQAQVNASTSACPPSPAPTPTPPQPVPPAPSGTQLAVSASGNDSTCVRGDLSKPCQSFNRAYQLAQCGDTVEIAGGSYPEQVLKERGGCASQIVLQARAGEVPYSPRVWFGSCVGCFAVDAADDLVLRGIKTAGVIMWGDSHNVTLDRIDGGAVFIRGPYNVQVRGSDFGPCPSSGGAANQCLGYYGPQQTRIASNDDSTYNSRNIVFENNVFHDHPRVQQSDHWECIWTNGGVDVTFRANRFYGCDTNGIAMGAGHAGTWLFENNWFGKAQTSALKFGGSFPGTVVIRFNSFAAGDSIVDEESGSPSNAIIVGNIIGTPSSWGSIQCVPGAQYSYNVFIGARTCGGTGNVTAPSIPYVNGSAFGDMDFRLGGASPADNLVPSGASYSDASRDYDGHERNAPRDAGADERS
jgi:chitodextrinase